MKVAEHLVQTLEGLGNRYIFGLPGSTEAPILDALAGRSGLEYILTLHESITVAMADGYARGSGGIGLANLHTTVGTANGLGQLYNAHRDGSPVVVLAGHKHTGIQNRDGFCVVADLPGMARPMVKWSAQSVRPDQVTADVCRAVKTALSAPAGPVYLALPEDLLGAESPGWDAGTGRPEPHLTGLTPRLESRPDRAALRAAVQLLSNARRPVLIAGDDVTKGDAVPALMRLAERLGAVVLHEPRRSASRFNFPSDHPQFAGEYSRKHPAVQEADLIFAVGCRLFVEFAPPKQPELPPGLPVIHLHADPREVAKLYPVTVGLTGSATGTLDEIGQLLADAKDSPPAGDPSRAWYAAHREAYLAAAAKERRVQAGGRPMRVSELFAAFADLAPAEVLVADEAVRSSRPLLRQVAFRYPNSYHRTCGGALGWGLPAAVGLQFAQPSRPVAAFVGDGSALFSVQALWTAAHYRQPVLFVILENGGYLAVKAAVKEYRGGSDLPGNLPGVAIGRPGVDYVSLAAGYGVPAARVRSVDAFRACLREAFQSGGPYLLAVQVAEEPI